MHVLGPLSSKIWRESRIFFSRVRRRHGHRVNRLGHHRITFDVCKISLPDRDAAKLWVIRNQLGRRNLTPGQASYLRGLEYEASKLPEHTGGRGKSRSGGKSRPHSTAARLREWVAKILETHLRPLVWRLCWIQHNLAG